jgi:hypothetical protein
MNTVWIPAAPIVSTVEMPGSPFHSLARFSRAQLLATRRLAAAAAIAHAR